MLQVILTLFDLFGDSIHMDDSSDRCLSHSFSPFIPLYTSLSFLVFIFPHASISFPLPIFLSSSNSIVPSLRGCCAPTSC